MDADKSLTIDFDAHDVHSSLEIVQKIDERIKELTWLIDANNQSIERFKKAYDKTFHKKYPARWFELENKNTFIANKIINFEKLKLKILKRE